MEPLMRTIHQYGGFRVDRDELYKLFYLIFNNPDFKKRDLAEESGFGDNKIENLRYYLRHFNLLDEKYYPTNLGKIVFEYDKYFEDEVTMWILFYHWAAIKSNPFLYYLLNDSLESRRKEELRMDFGAWAIGNNIKVDYKKDYVGGLLSITLNALLDSGAFENLNVFTLHGNRYIRDYAYKTNPLLFAYVLYDNRHGRTTISFEELLKESNNIGKFFNLDRESLQKQIYAMRDIGLVQYVQTANLQHIVLTFEGTPLTLLERYYEGY